MPSFEPQPGIVATPTKAKGSMNWSDGNLMRWSRGKMAPVGGWTKLGLTAPASKIRRVIEWRDNTDRQWTGYLCDSHIYVEYEGDLVDVTPLGGMTAPSTSLTAGGYGDDLYSLDEYGTPRPDQIDRKVVGWAFTVDNWGETLLAMTSIDGRLLQWTPPISPAAPARALVVANAPVNNRTFVVTPERYVILFDYDDIQGEFAWCDQEDITDWNFADIASKAGTLPIEPRAECICAAFVPGGVLQFTTRTTNVINHIGLPYIFNVDPVSEGNAPVSDRCLVKTINGATWLSESGVWAFNGVSVAPVDCDVWNKIDTLIDWTKARFYAAAVNIENQSEIWFFVPRVGDLKNQLLIIYNYKEGWWSLGLLARSAGASSTYTTYPIMADELEVFQHETGTRMDGAGELPWIESFPLELGDGDQFTLKQIQPDVEGDFTSVRFSAKYRQRLATNSELQTALRQIYDGFVDIQETGRDFRVRIECIVNPVGVFTVGKSEASVTGRGKRK